MAHKSTSKYWPQARFDRTCKEILRDLAVSKGSHDMYLLGHPNTPLATDRRTLYEEAMERQDLSRLLCLYAEHLRHHDWYYALSDDFRVWQKGEQYSGELNRWKTEIKGLARELGTPDPTPGILWFADFERPDN